jgi:hypothetical protein
VSNTGVSGALVDLIMGPIVVLAGPGESQYEMSLGYTYEPLTSAQVSRR